MVETGGMAAPGGRIDPWPDGTGLFAVARNLVLGAAGTEPAVAAAVVAGWVRLEHPEPVNITTAIAAPTITARAAVIVGRVKLRDFLMRI